jgi:hypothetical protein
MGREPGFLAPKFCFLEFGGGRSIAVRLKPLIYLKTRCWMYNRNSRNIRHLTLTPTLSQGERA